MVSLINNIMNKSTSENTVNISNFLNNECVNIYLMWYRLYMHPLGKRDADIIDLNYKKEWNVLFKNQIISDEYSKTPFLVRFSALYTKIMLRTSARQGLHS